MTNLDMKAHWENIYATRPSVRVSWYAEHLEASLSFIERTCRGTNARIIDVGGGASTLIDDLLDRGYTTLTVLDISKAALDAARSRLGERAAVVSWMEADILNISIPADAFDIWHDRAVFHFLTEPEQRQSYIRQVSRALAEGGEFILATFALDGPEKCSGLPTERYDAPKLQAEIGDAFDLLDSERVLHKTPFGTDQVFLYCRFRRKHG